MSEAQWDLWFRCLAQQLATIFIILHHILEHVVNYTVQQSFSISSVTWWIRFFVGIGGIRSVQSIMRTSVIVIMRSNDHYQQPTAELVHAQAHHIILLSLCYAADYCLPSQSNIFYTISSKSNTPMRIYSLQIGRLFNKLCAVVSVLGSAVKMHIFYGRIYWLLLLSLWRKKKV